MDTAIIQSEYEQLRQVASRFRSQAERTVDVESHVKQVVGMLQQGGWHGTGALAFFDEMDSEIFPAVARLASALEEAQSVTLRIANVLRQAEEEAAKLFQGDSAVLPMQGTQGITFPLPDPGLLGWSSGNIDVPSPRVYLVNGINSNGNVDEYGNPAYGDDQSIAMKAMIERYGYDSNEVKTTQAIYLRPQGTELSGTLFAGTDFGGWLSPIDWITDQVASTVNALTDRGAAAINYATGVIASNDTFSSFYGATQVAVEYVSGERGYYSQKVYHEIARDLAENPLLPGQSLILMGHSGGGAVVTNLSGMLERNLGVDVSGVVTMGSPVANFDEARRYAEHVVDIRHAGDRVAAPLGTPVLRSEEARWGIVFGPRGMLAAEILGRDMGAPGVSTVILTRPPTERDAHGSYMHDSGVSMDMLRELNRTFPNLRLQLPQPAL